MDWLLNDNGPRKKSPTYRPPALDNRTTMPSHLVVQTSSLRNASSQS